MKKMKMIVKIDTPLTFLYQLGFILIYYFTKHLDMNYRQSDILLFKDTKLVEILT